MQRFEKQFSLGRATLHSFVALMLGIGTYHDKEFKPVKAVPECL
jgi:hypothetical protein